MPIALDVHGVDGAVTGSVDLDDSYFGIQPNVPVMHQVVTAQLAAARAGTQSTKTRAEVSGGGKKPFKQKGTGRARQGSERAPHFTGGGVALGPKPRSYRQRTPRKMIHLALRSALSDRAADGKVKVVSAWSWETPSTKSALAALQALEVEGKVLVILDRTDEEAYKSFRNLPGVQLLLAPELNAYDILCNDWIVFTSDTLPGGDGTAEPADAAGASDVADAPAGADDAPADAAPADAAPADEGPAAEASAAEESATDALAGDVPAADVMDEEENSDE